MNDLTSTQISTIVNAIMGQVTGVQNLANVSTSDFVAVANTALLASYDPLLDAVSQTLSSTIFSIRPYNRKFRSINVSNQKFGNHVRKLQAIDSDFEDDQTLPLANGTSVDMYAINKTNVLQTNFYGQTRYQRHTTIWQDQLDVALRNQEEFARFIVMILQNADDQIEQAHENLARYVVSNFIGAKITADAANVVHLLTDYNNLTGAGLTATSLYEPENFAPFMRWVSSEIQTYSDAMEERTGIYHMNVTGKTINRHTPKRMQRFYVLNEQMNAINANVLSQTFHDNYIKYGVTEKVLYWQSIKDWTTIDLNVSYMDANGNVATADVKQSQIFGVLFDEEALGYTVIGHRSHRTPFNAAAEYSNIYWHFTDRFWNDLTENAFVFLLD